MDLNPLKIDRGEAGPRARRSKRSVPYAGLVVLALIGGGLFLFRRPLLDAVDRWRLPSVRTTTAVRTSPAAAVTGVSSNGYIVAAKRAALSADTPGRIVEMLVTEGSVVEKGQVVARLYADEYRAAVRRTQADLAAQAKTIERTRAQAQATGADLVRLEAEVARSAANVAEQSAALELARVKEQRAEKMLAEAIWTAQALDDARTERVRSEAALAAAQAARLAAEAALAQGRTQVAAADAAVAEAQARVAVIEAERDQAQAALDKTEVRAPFDGIVVLKDAEVGEVVSPNSQGGNSRGSVATMVDWASLEVQVELQQTSLSAAELDTPANIYLDAYLDHPYTGRVTRIWPTANRQKATVEVRLSFDRPDGLLKPDLGVRVVFSPKAAEAEGPAGREMVVVARDAVVKIDGVAGVFELERDVARWRAVGLGDERAGRVVIESGLSGGERLVLAPPSGLRDGDRVWIEE